MSTVNPIEGLWLVLSLLGTVFTIMNLADANSEWHDMEQARDHATTLGIARTVVAKANTRREGIRLVIQIIFLLLVLPAIQRPGDTPLTIWLVLFMSFPLLMAVNSYLDGRVRRDLARLAGDL